MKYQIGVNAFFINSLKSFQAEIISSGSFQAGREIILTSNQSFFIFSKLSFVAFCQALSQSKHKKTFFVSLFTKVRCFSVRAVPETATQFKIHPLFNAITSIYHSQIITKSSFVIACLALKILYKILLLS
jgi:hypothetical protein